MMHTELTLSGAGKDDGDFRCQKVAKSYYSTSVSILHVGL